MVQRLELVVFRLVEGFDHENELLARVIDHIVLFVIFNVISDRYIQLEHRMVRAL